MTDGLNVHQFGAFVVNKKLDVKEECLTDDEAAEVIRKIMYDFSLPMNWKAG